MALRHPVDVKRTSNARYHHGDLRAACLRAAMELLEEDGATALSLRAVARRAGVSPGAHIATTPTVMRSSPQSPRWATANRAHTWPRRIPHLIGLILAWLQHRQEMRSLQTQLAVMPYSISGAMAALIAGLGILALVVVVMRLWPCESN